MSSRFDKDAEVQFREDVMEEFKKLHEELAELRKQLYGKAVEKTEVKATKKE